MTLASHSTLSATRLQLAQISGLQRNIEQRTPARSNVASKSARGGRQIITSIGAPQPRILREFMGKPWRPRSLLYGRDHRATVESKRRCYHSVALRAVQRGQPCGPAGAFPRHQGFSRGRPFDPCRDHRVLVCCARFNCWCAAGACPMVQSQRAMRRGHGVPALVASICQGMQAEALQRRFRVSP